MGWMKSLFSSPEIVKDGLSAITSGVDKAILTKEESTEYFLKYLEATIPMNRSRRILAFGVTFVWVLGFFLGAVCLLTDYKVQEVTQFLSVYVMPSFTILTTWYFWRRMGKK